MNAYTSEKLIDQKIPIQNQIVEENEEIQIQLSEHYSGNLLQYDINTIVIDSPGFVDINMSKLISLKKPFNVLGQMYLHNSTFQSNFEAFPRSTLLYEYKNQIFLFLIDRNFHLRKYDVTDFTQGKMTLLIEIPLNTTWVNEYCHDLTHIQDMQNGFVLFCQSVNKTEKDPFTRDRERFYTIVKFEGFLGDHDNQYITYYVSKYRQFNYDLSTGMRLMKIYYDTSSLVYYALFIAKLDYVDSVEGNQDQAVIFSLNMTHLQIDVENNVTFSFEEQDQALQIYGYINFKEDDEKLGSKTIIDFTNTQEQNPHSIAFLFKGCCVVFVNFESIEFKRPDKNKPYIFDYNSSKRNRFQLDIKQAVSIHYNRQDTYHVFITTSMPPGVVQINIKNPYSPHIQKIFSIDYQKNYFIGLPYLAINNNFLIHAVRDISSQVPTLRAYFRNGTYFNLGRYDLKMNRDFRPNYIFFPNYYLNLILYRDENILNVTYIGDQRIILNASDSELVKQFDQRTIKVTLSIMHKFTSMQQAFNVTFVNKSNNQIYQTRKQYNLQDKEIFYNCGDSEFSYVVKGYFNGPNYALRPVGDEKERCKDQPCYFVFNNIEIFPQNKIPFDFTQCTRNHLLRPTQIFKNYKPDSLILICINTKMNKISSFIVPEIEGQVIKTNEIFLPSSIILEHSFDADDRMLFVICREPNPELYEQIIHIHFFKIENQIIWEGQFNPQLDLYGDYFQDIQSYSYNPHSNTGVLVNKVQNEKGQLVNFFIINAESYKFRRYVSQWINITNFGIIKKAIVANNRFVYALLEEFKFRIFQVSNDLILYAISSMNVFQFRSKNIHDFDIFGDKYLVVYQDSNLVEVWQISMYIYLDFKMSLPLYKEFAELSFFNTMRPNLNRILRHQSQNYLMLIMSNEQKYYALVYNLDQTKHSSLILSSNITIDVQSTRYIQPIIKVESEVGKRKSFAGILTDYFILPNDLYLENSLTVDNTDEETHLKLYESCKNLSLPMSPYQGHTSQRLTEIIIEPFSMFKTVDQKEFINDELQITLKIISENQGIIMTSNNDSNNYKISIANDYMRDGLVLLDNYISGSNVRYIYSCQYSDQNGELQPCLDGIEDQLKYFTLNFYLEQVTSTTYIIKAFSLQDLFISFDSSFKIQVLQLPQPQDHIQKNKYRNIEDYKKVNAYPLEQIQEIMEFKALQCEKKGLIKVFEIKKLKNHTLYLLVFECQNDFYNRYIGAVQFTIYDTPFNDKGHRVTFQWLQALKQISHKVIDLELINIYAHSENGSIYSFAVTMEIQGSYSNKLEIFEMNIDNYTYEAPLTFISVRLEITAQYVGLDTFYATQLLSIPNSRFVIVVCRDYGLLFVDVNDLIIRHRLTLNKGSDNQFYQQSVDRYGPLFIYQVVGQWPHVVHILTNHGIFIIDFLNELTNRTQITHQDITKNFIVVNKYHIRFDMKHYYNEIVSNPYGYAFFITDYKEDNQFDILLVIVSYNSNKNSKIYKVRKVSKNQECNSLSIIESMASPGQEEMILSYVCYTQLFIMRVRLKSVIKVDMINYRENSTKLIYNKFLSNGKANQFNRYLIEFSAHNDQLYQGFKYFSIDLDFEVYPQTITTFIINPYYTIFIAAFAIQGIIIIVLKCKNSDREQENIQEIEQMLKERRSTFMIRRQLSSNYNLSMLVKQMKIIRSPSSNSIFEIRR